MKVSDVMIRRVTSVSPDATILQAVGLMLKHHISGLPVVDDDGSLVGIVTEGDFLRRPETGTERKRSRWLDALLGPGEAAKSYVQSHGMKICEVMTKKVITVHETDPLDEVVHLMEVHKIKRLPVVRRGKVIGVVSRANLIHALASLHRGSRTASKSDAAIRNQILIDIGRQGWTVRRRRRQSALSIHTDVFMREGALCGCLKDRDRSRRSSLNRVECGGVEVLGFSSGPCR